MSQPDAAGAGVATAGTLGNAEHIREVASFGILTGTVSSGVFPVAHGQTTNDAVPPNDIPTAVSLPVAQADDIWG